MALSFLGEMMVISARLRDVMANVLLFAMSYATLTKVEALSYVDVGLRFRID